MSGRHHIHRQYLTLEAPGLKAEDKWPDRLERFQDLQLLPVLQEAFDAADDGTIRFIDRLEVTVTIQDLERLEREVTPRIRTEVERALRAVQQQKGTLAAGPFDQILSYLRTGNMPWAAGSAADLRKMIEEWLGRSSPNEWRILFLAWADQPAAFFGRCTQVGGGLVEAGWRALLTLIPDEDAPSHMRLFPATDPAVWRSLINDYVLSPPGMKALARDKASAPVQSEAATGDSEPSAVDDSNSWHPANSGIVILHPYLNYFLKEVECEDADRAATLFHYLVWGTTDCAEWDLPLSKLLLGLHPDDYLSPSADLSQSDRAATDELLEGIIGHWTALKNTSIHALRDGFLQRPGRLVREGRGWRLTVEEKPQDLLLDRLPWSIGMVTSKRMNTTLYVDWR